MEKLKPKASATSATRVTRGSHTENSFSLILKSATLRHISFSLTHKNTISL